MTGRGAPPPSSNVLRLYLSAWLPDYMLPSVFVALDELPLTPSGKIDHRRLPDPGHLKLHAGADVAAPRSELELQLVCLWEEVLGRQPVGIHDDFFEIGGHSLLAAVLVSKIKERLGCRLSLAALLQAPTIAQLAARIECGRTVDSSSLLLPIQAAGSQAPFFCVHGYGGDVVGYYKLAHLLGPDQPFYGIQAQGLYDGLEPHADVASMAEAYVQAMRKLQPQGPYYLGGYCDGGVIAYEMARQLYDQGQQVALLAVFEAYAVDRGDAQRQHWRPSVLTSFVCNLPYWMRDNVPHMMRQNADASLPPEGDSSSGGSRTAPHPSRRRRVLDVHGQAIADYRPQPYGGHVTLFRVHAMSLFRSYDPTLGWEGVAGGVTVRMIPGAHYNILEHPHVEGLAAELRSALAESHMASTPVGHRAPLLPASATRKDAPDLQGTRGP
jgi:thioesterase domain-containing protein/acyl carrier protein